ncbi:phosphatidylethanolamine N-methyltransferase isoform X3 [Eptesicus fuscus]|uniref:phosphatidylethanolamine N-methyltransferase isoform X3 n=1 Tax=Eptesicus fuscus TaxID=29078 RepID=UPI00240433EE|nr:phosphatidylethanolamine N-methyltransferase isoform X3 [Eptesicus fuscus]
MGPVLGQVVARSPRGPSRGGPQGRGSGAGSRAYEQVGGGARLLRRPGQHRLQADLCVMTRLLGYVDPWEPCFVAAVLAIVFNPLFWNVVHSGHAEPAPDGQPGHPHGLPGRPRAAGRRQRAGALQLLCPGLHRDLPGHASPAGLLLTGVVALVYVAATLYEEPFTAEIYRQKASQSRKSR